MNVWSLAVRCSLHESASPSLFERGCIPDYRIEGERKKRVKARRAMQGVRVPCKRKERERESFAFSEPQSSRTEACAHVSRNRVPFVRAYSRCVHCVYFECVYMRYFGPPAWDS